MKTPLSTLGKGSAIGAIITFVIWVSQNTPEILLPIWIILGIISIIDYMKGGLTDESVLE